MKNKSNIRLKNIINNISVLKTGSLRNYQICSYNEILYIQKYCSKYNIDTIIVFTHYTYVKGEVRDWTRLYYQQYTIISNVSISGIYGRLKEKCVLYIQLLKKENINMMNYYEYNDYINNIVYNPIKHIIDDCVFNVSKKIKYSGLLISKKVYGELLEYQVNYIKMYCDMYNIHYNYLFSGYEKYMKLCVYECNKNNMYGNYQYDINKYSKNITINDKTINNSITHNEIKNINDIE